MIRDSPYHDDPEPEGNGLLEAAPEGSTEEETAHWQAPQAA